MTVRAWFVRLLGLFRRRHLENELNEDIQAHLEMAVEENLRRGMTPQEAQEAARRSFGGVEQMKEAFRDQRRIPVLESLIRDARFGLRTLGRSPGFTLVAVLTLGLGIGANTAIFSVVNAVMLEPLGYPQPEQLRFLTTGGPDGGRGEVSPPEYFELTEISHSFSVVGAFVVREVNLSARDRPRRVTRATVNAELFEALAVPPERGRWFRREETRPGGPALAILSHELWRSAFAAREDIVGQSIEIDGVGHEVIGIMPPRFDLMDKRVELWLPIQFNPTQLQYRESHFLSVLGRLKDGVTPEQAEAELASLVASWSERTGVRGHVFRPGDHVM